MMGGSGGSFFGGDPQDIADKLRRAEQEIEDQTFRAQVETVLSEALANVNDRDADAVAQHLEQIQGALEKDIDGVIELLFGGSVAKHTYVEGVSDIDALVVVNESELADVSPKAVCSYILTRLSDRLPDRVSADGFAITVEFSDVSVQVVPVIRRGKDYLLPSNDCSSWSRVRPHAFTDELTKTNKDCSGKVVPTIKLAKVLLSSIPEARRPSGYHLENLAVNIFSTYTGPYTPRAMLHHFFSRAPERIRQRMPERTGQSSHVDDYLGPRNSVERLVVSDAVGRIARRLRNADGSRDIGQWKRLLGTD